MNAVAFLSAGHNTRRRWGDLPAWWELASLRVNQVVAALLLLLVVNVRPMYSRQIQNG